MRRKKRKKGIERNSSMAFAAALKEKPMLTPKKKSCNPRIARKEGGKGGCEPLKTEEKERGGRGKLLETEGKERRRLKLPRGRHDFWPPKGHATQLNKS